MPCFPCSTSFLGNLRTTHLWILHLKFRDFRTQARARHADPGDRDRQLEAARTGTAGSEKQDPLTHLDHGLMGMPVHSRPEARIRRIESKLRNLMENVEPAFAD